MIYDFHLQSFVEIEGDMLLYLAKAFCDNLIYSLNLVIINFDIMSLEIVTASFHLGVLSRAVKKICHHAVTMLFVTSYVKS